MGDSGPGRSKRGTPPSQTAEKAKSTDPFEEWTEEILQEINRRLREETAFFAPDLAPEAATEAKAAGDLPPAAEPQPSADPEAHESVSADAPTAGTGADAAGQDGGPVPSAGDAAASDAPPEVAGHGPAKRDGLMTGDLADNVRDAFSLAAQVLGAPADDGPAPQPVQSAHKGGRGPDADGPAEDPGHQVTNDESPEPPGSADASRKKLAPDDQIFDALAGKTQAPNPNRLQNGPTPRVDGTAGGEGLPENPETTPPENEGSAPTVSGAAHSPSTARATKPVGPTTSDETRAPDRGEAPAALAAAEEYGGSPERPPAERPRRWFLPVLDGENGQSHAKEGRRIAARVGLQAYGLSTTRSGASKAPWLGRAAVIAIPLLVFLAGGFIGWSTYWTEVSDVPEVDRAGETPAASVADATQEPRVGADSVAQTKPATFPEPQQTQAASGQASEPDESTRVADTTAAVGPVAGDVEDDLAKDSTVQAPAPAQTDAGVVTATGSAAVAGAEPPGNSADVAAIGDRGAQDGAASLSSQAPAATRGVSSLPPTALPGRPVETAAMPSLRAANAAGTAGNPIPLSVAALPTTVKGGLSFMIAGVPPGVSLSAGSDKGDGTWILRPEDLDGLSLTPPSGYNGAFVLTVSMMKDRGTAKTATSEILEVTVEGPAPDITRLIARGDSLLKLGDIASARLMFERAAVHGSAVAATAVGKTHDPVFHMELGVMGPQADSEAAADWYRKGLAGGDRAAEARLAKLEKWLTLRRRSPAQ